MRETLDQLGRLIVNHLGESRAGLQHFLALGRTRRGIPPLAVAALELVLVQATEHDQVFAHALDDTASAVIATTSSAITEAKAAEPVRELTGPDPDDDTPGMRLKRRDPWRAAGASSGEDEARAAREREELKFFDLLWSLGPRQTEALAVPITIFVSKESVHEQVEAAVEELVEALAGHIGDREEPVIGSWFRQMTAWLRTPVGEEAKAVATHALESRLVLQQDAAVTATMMQHLGDLVKSLESTAAAVIRVGALLIVKFDGTLVVHQLTAIQQLKLDHNPVLAHMPHKVLAALEIRPDDAAATTIRLDADSVPHAAFDEAATRSAIAEAGIDQPE
jgi:hypothetical protein